MLGYLEYKIQLGKEEKRKEKKRKENREGYLTKFLG